MAVVMVRVREDCRWEKMRVGGREFTKRGEMMSEAALTDEMRRSLFLQVGEPEVEAKKSKPKGRGTSSSSQRATAKAKAGG